MEKRLWLPVSVWVGLERAMAGRRTWTVAVLGASGYTGGDLLRLLVGRTDVRIVALTAERYRGARLGDVFAHLDGLSLPTLAGIEEIDWRALAPDVIFCALPHATSGEAILRILKAMDHPLLQEAAGTASERYPRFIDLSADFRLLDPDVYAAWYGRAHPAPRLQEHAVYGLSEWNREAIARAPLVACPGCYPTAALLALLPLIAQKGGPLIAPEPIVIDAKSGVSGAGRGLKPEMLFCEVAESVRPYGVGRHRHMPEIEQELARAFGHEITISFTPHLVPMNRGELVTCYVRCAPGVAVADLKKALQARYANEPFVFVPEDDRVPATRDVRGSNRALVNVFADHRAGHAIVIAAIDNLVKGSAGQAVQNMNMMLGVAETRGLEACPIFP